MMLFDLAADPGEQHNVAAQNPEVVSRLARIFNEMADQVPSDLVAPRSTAIRRPGPRPTE
jgi:hypothetical protein